MEINITSSSSSLCRNRIIEVNSIDEAIEKLRTDKELVKSVINGEHSVLIDTLIPNSFIVKTYSSIIEKCNYEIEIYDYYRE